MKNRPIRTEKAELEQTAVTIHGTLVVGLTLGFGVGVVSLTTTTVRSQACRVGCQVVRLSGDHIATILLCHWSNTNTLLVDWNGTQPD